MKKSSSLLLNETAPSAGPALDFELPDWSGHLPSRHAGSKDAWIAYCRSNLPKLKKIAGYPERRLSHGVAAEFHL